MNMKKEIKKKSEEQRAKSRGQRAESKVQRVRSEKQSTGCKEQGASNQKQVTSKISTVLHVKKPSAIGKIFFAEGCISEYRAIRACLMIRIYNN
jgi:hypothetical protein